MIKNKKVITCIVSFICIMLILANFTYALDTSVYSQMYTNNGSQSSIRDAGGYVLGLVQTIGMAVAVIILVVLGIKYMVSSPEDKATIKDKASMYVVGAIIIFAASGLVGLVSKYATEKIK